MTGVGSTAAPRSAQLEVQVRAGRAAGRADVADHRSRRRRTARGGPRSATGARTSSSCRAVAEDDELAVAAGVAVRDLDAAGRARAHGSPARRDEVEPGVERDAARAEAVADRVGHRAEEAQRRARRRAAQGGERGGAGDAVGGEPGPRLEAPQRGVGVAPRPPSNVPDGKPWRGEQELQRRDVPAAGVRASSGRLPSRGRPRRPSARRVRGPTMPSAGRPRRRWRRWTAATVAGPATPSTAPA